MSNFQPTYDEERGIYKDCKWCHGKGCVYCPGEADAAYKRQFPDGPKPIATIPLDHPIDLSSDSGQKELIELLRKHTL